MNIDTTQVTWYEENSMMEFWENPEPSSRKIVICSLEDAIQFVWKNKFCLYIQPEMQDSGLFIDYTK